MLDIRKSLISLSRDLRWQLLSLYLLSVAFVFVAGLLFARSTNASLITETKFTDLALAQAIAQETGSVIERPLQAVKYLAAQPGVIEADLAQMGAQFRIIQQTNSDYNLVYRLNEGGTMIFHYPAGTRSTVGQDFSFRQYFQQAQLKPEPLISVGRTSPTTGQPVVTIVMPLWDEADNFLGIVGINFDLQALSQTLSDVVLQQNAKPHLNITIIDSGGKILASLTPNLLLQNINKVFPNLSPGAASNTIEIAANRQEFLVSAAPVVNSDWSVLVSRPTNIAFATLSRFQRGFLLLMLLYLGIGLLSWIVLSKRLFVPLQDITSYIKDRRVDEPVPPTSTHSLSRYAARPDQVGQLGKSVIETEKVIMARLDELTTLLETSTAVTSSLDTNTVLASILSQVEEILKIDKSAIIFYDEVEQVCRISAGRKLSSRYLQQFSVPDNPDRLSMVALRQGQFVQITDLADHEEPERIAPGALAEGVRAIFAIPLKTTHALPSVLVGYKTQAYAFNPREINLLNNFANHAAMALENATLYARSDILLKEQTHRLEALVHSLGDGLVLEDLTGNIRYSNRWMSDFTGLPIDTIQQSSIDSLLNHLHNQAITTKYVDPDIPNGDEIFALPDRSRFRYLRSEIFDVTDHDAQTIGRGLLLQDITKNYELDRMKSLLISTVSHELRTPLASIKGYASTLLAEDVEWDVAEQHEFLEIISDEADRLNRLVNDLLDMSRLEAGRLRLSLVPCELSHVISKAVGQVHPPALNRLQVELPARLPPLLADPQRLEVVVRNLIENAAKYADPGSPITISATAKNGSITVIVSDQGPGIPEPHRQRIFDTFYRVDDGLTRQSGFGLGLAICQGFIRAQGGRIWIEPKSSGTSIAFSLPLYKSGE